MLIVVTIGGLRRTSSQAGRIILRRQVTRCVLEAMLRSPGRRQRGEVTIGIVVVANEAVVWEGLLNEASSAIVLIASRSIQRVGHRFQIPVAVVGECQTPSIDACPFSRAGQPPATVVDE